MKSDWAGRLSWTATAILFVLLLCHQWSGSDIWYHLYLGERIFQVRSPQPSDHLLLHQTGFINTYWFFQLIVRGVFACDGIFSVSLLFIALWTATLGYWLATIGPTRAGGWFPVLPLAAVLICQTRFEHRPEVVSYLFLALQIHWLTQWKLELPPAPREFLRFIAVQAAWSNIHGYFIFGPALAGLRLAGILAQSAGSDWARCRPGRNGLCQLLGLALLASLASPFGFRNWREAALLARFFRQMHFSIREFLPPVQVPVHLWSLDLFQGCWWAVLIALVYVALTSARREAFALLLAAFGLVLSADAFRNIPLLVFLSAPLLGAIAPALARHAPAQGVTALAAGAVALALATTVVSDRYYRATGGVPGFGIRESHYGCPVYFTDYLRSHPFLGSIFNSPEDGGYLEFHFPDLHLYGDTRFVDAPQVRRYFAALADPFTLRSLVKQQDFDGLLLRVTESPNDIAVWLREPGWLLAYADLHRAFLVDRRRPAGARAAPCPPRFYRGEDLAVPVDGASAAGWISIFIQTDDRVRLLDALRQFSRAPALPSELLRLALGYGRSHSDAEVTALAAALRPRLIACSPAESAAVDSLLPTGPGP